MKSIAEGLSVPSFDNSTINESTNYFIDALKMRLNSKHENDLMKLKISQLVINEANNKTKPIATSHGLLFTIANNSTDHRKLEIIIDEMNKVILSFFFFKTKRSPTHYVMKCNSSLMPIDEIVEKFINYRLLPNYNVQSYRNFNETDWSEESTNYAKSDN